MKAVAKAYNIDTLRQLPENKKCFDCQQKVTEPPQFFASDLYAFFSV